MKKLTTVAQGAAISHVALGAWIGMLGRSVERHGKSN